MKNIIRILASVSALAALASCQQFVVDTQMTDEEYAKHIQLVCDAQDSYTFAAQSPQAVVFSVSSNASWTVSGGAEWLRVTPSSSSVSGLIADVSVSAQDNPELTERTATITIKNDKYDTEVYTVNFTQARKGMLYVQPVYEQFNAKGGSLPFTIESNQNWWIRSSEAWLSFSQTSGTGSGSVVNMTATALANDGLERRAIVTVGTSTEEVEFEAIQKGVSFEIVTPADPTVSSMGGELVVEMNSSVDWTIKNSNDAFKVEKTDDSHFTVSAPFNNKFAERTTTVTVESKVGKEELVVSQGTNFTVENAEVLEDGSVKLSGAKKSRVYINASLRYFDFILTFGDKNFGDKGQCWLHGSLNNVNIYNQLTLGGNLRMRTDGTMKNGESAYCNGKFSITKDELNAMNTYEVKIVPDAENPAKMDCAFIYNGTPKTESVHPNIFECDPDYVTDYYFGFYSSTDDGSTYVVTSCDFTAIPE